MKRVGFVCFTPMSGHRDSSAPWLQGQIQPNIYQPQYHIYDRLSIRSKKVAAKITKLKCSIDYETAATHSSDQVDHWPSRNNSCNID